MRATSLSPPLLCCRRRTAVQRVKLGAPSVRARRLTGEGDFLSSPEPSACVFETSCAPCIPLTFSEFERERESERWRFGLFSLFATLLETSLNSCFISAPDVISIFFLSYSSVACLGGAEAAINGAL